MYCRYLSEIDLARLITKNIKQLHQQDLGSLVIGDAVIVNECEELTDEVLDKVIGGVGTVWSISGDGSANIDSAMLFRG